MDDYTKHTYQDTFLTTVFDLAYIFSPVVGFIPQLYRQEITYNASLSVLTILASILKIFSYKDSNTSTAHQDTKASSTMMAQFIICIVLHMHLLNLRFKQDKTPPRNTPVSHLLARMKNSNRWIVTGVVGIVMILKFFNILPFTSLFMKVAVAIEILIAILHIKYYSDTKSKPVELFMVWIIGDLIKMYLMYMRYTSPLECYLGVVVQILINLYVFFS